MIGDKRVIEPGATLGVLGGGQLGRMFAMAAARLGYRVRVFADAADAPASQVAAEAVVAPMDDVAAARRFAAGVAAVTLEFENVPVATVESVQALAPVRPGVGVLAMAQHRFAEREFLARHGLPTAKFMLTRSADEATSAVAAVGGAAVLKSATLGYDGKGQARAMAPDQAADAWRQCGASEVLCEALVDFRLELSVIVARGLDGAMATFGPIENAHHNHILDVSVYPAGVAERVSREAGEIARAVAEGCDLVGVLCVEMFLTHDDTLLVNEIAPRPHNSGHLTIEACSVSQFEQQVRTMSGLPLGEMARRGACTWAMANLLGDLWTDGEPNWAELLKSHPQAALHLYGKHAARPGRKMGHVTMPMALDADIAATARGARERLLVR